MPFAAMTCLCFCLSTLVCSAEDNQYRRSLEDHARRTERYIGFQSDDAIAGHGGPKAIAQMRALLVIARTYRRKHLETQRELIGQVLASGNAAVVEQLAYHLSLQAVRDHRYALHVFQCDPAFAEDPQSAEVRQYLVGFLGKRDIVE